MIEFTSRNRYKIGTQYKSGDYKTYVICARIEQKGQSFVYRVAEFWGKR